VLSHSSPLFFRGLFIRCSVHTIVWSIFCTWRFYNNFPHVILHIKC
jgi:hypothetical protein